jgi:hypothetical protein
LTCARVAAIARDGAQVDGLRMRAGRAPDGAVGRALRTRPLAARSGRGTGLLAHQGQGGQAARPVCGRPYRHNTGRPANHTVVIARPMTRRDNGWAAPQPSGGCRAVASPRSCPRDVCGPPQPDRRRRLGSESRAAARTLRTPSTTAARRPCRRMALPAQATTTCSPRPRFACPASGPGNRADSPAAVTFVLR